MKRTLTIVIVALVALTGFWYFSGDASEATITYRFAEITAGNLESVVASTGNLDAVITVQVGTQVSGKIDRIYVDFNDQVKKGQIIAQIDTLLLGSAVREAEANLERLQAQFDYAKQEHKRIKILHDRGISTEVELNKVVYDVQIATANLKSSKLSLERAENNLAYATIVAPIDGTVIERNVDVGQTVAASLSAPQLFLIANDLAQMQILASVDESDIGLIEEGQNAKFSVQAYPEDEFIGTVRQVRMQSFNSENVVNYMVVVDVINDQGLLLPGMTATTNFVIEQAEDVLKLPNSALRFRPSETMMTEFRERMQARREAAESDTSSARPRGDQPGRMPQFGQGGRPGAGQGGGQQGGGFGSRGGSGASDRATLWYLDENGDPMMMRVRTGISDGQMTEVIGRRIEEGMQIITGVTTTATEPSTSTNPFQQQQQGGRRGGGRF